MIEKGDGSPGVRSGLPPDAWRLAYAAMVFAAAVFLVVSIHRVVVVSPLLAYFLLLILLSPYAGTKNHLRAVIAATILLAVWLLETLGGLLAPFLLALAISYILDPAVDMLEKRGIKRMLAIGILGVPVLAVLAGIAIFGVPALVEQAGNVIEGTPEAVQQVRQWLENMRARLSQTRIPILPDLLRDPDLLNPERIGAILREHQARILEGGLGTLLGIGRGVGAALTVLGYIVLTPVLMVYLLRDFDRITARMASLIPLKKRERWTAMAREYDGLLSRFLRGQLVAAAIVGVLTWLGLRIAGFPNSGLVGVTAGIFNVVPYLGLVVSIVPVVIISLVSGAVIASLVKAGIVFAIVQFIDSSVTGPRIVGDSVGLHPVWVILAIAVGSFFYGFVGLLLAMPAAVLIKLLIREGVARYRGSRVFQGTPESGEFS
ncbi:MAG: AI-2E family transporter [Longimicrobiales bacterium]